MDFNAVRARELLEHADFVTLFVEELGWDRHSDRFELTVAGEMFSFRAVAEKKGATAFICDVREVPQKALRLKIDREISKRAFEHIVVFSAEGGAQVWNWPRRLPDRPVSLMDHAYRSGEQNTAFLQRLRGISFSLAEENDLTLPDVTKKLDASLNAEKVTKRFFADFSNEHKKFLGFIEGITDVADREWYASLMLNRLMFIYFMQRKGFLDGNINYLREKLVECQDREGRDAFYPFYRYFLLRLFHEGLGGKERNAELEKLIGRVPYLNGGLFEKHLVEDRSPNIQIPDEAFQRIFDYFDRYKWHLDERPLRDENEINPDVLGYIFEKYINQKQMGAYYTKEDITGYITQNTVIPFLLEAAKVECRVAFENPGGPTVWDHLRDDPDRYIFKAVRHGIEHTLPDEIVAGIGDVSRRADWNKAAPEEFGLPTEIWREVVARRTRCEELRRTLIGGEVRDVNDLIRLNLDIRQFAQDLIDRAEGPDLLRATWKAVERVTVLDPTCGSGAFLFAALNVLEPLYEACLDRMETFVTDLDRYDSGQGIKRFEDFRKTLARVETHPNRRYFILKSIILNNLFGVDIMEEAVEICKLRLFLKLAAQVDPDDSHDNLGIEPLPDIDFNVRSGNTLVGYSTYEHVQVALGRKLDLDDNLGRITRAAADLQQAADVFRARQVDGDGSVPAEDKASLRQRLVALDEELSRQLASEYGVKAQDAASIDRWVTSHEPFHWFVEFYGIMNRGGFDVVIGNPPFVEYHKIRSKYSVLDDYQTLSCGNIYALVIERSFQLCSSRGWVSMIAPISLVSTSRTQAIRELVRRRGHWISSYDMRPGSLFEGVAQRLTILVARGAESLDQGAFVGGYRRWSAAERNQLIELTKYTDASQVAGGPFPKIELEIERSILSKIAGDPMERMVDRNADPILVHRIIRYFVKALDFIPTFIGADGIEGKSADYKEFQFSRDQREVITALLNSTLFYWFWRLHSDGFHCGYADVYAMPYRPVTDKVVAETLSRLSGELMDHLRDTSELKSITTKAGRIRYQEFRMAGAKPLIDKIDVALATHYGLSAEESDFIVNYDVKYRLGGAVDEGPEVE